MMEICLSATKKAPLFLVVRKVEQMVVGIDDRQFRLKDSLVAPVKPLCIHRFLQILCLEALAVGEAPSSICELGMRVCVFD